jgi:uncharacterized membrane protein YeaQ/YmgE (transglycosylase-associated protein family)
LVGRPGDQRRCRGLIGDIVGGIVGSLIAGYLLAMMGILGAGCIRSVITALIGSYVLSTIVPLVER